jgi:hypothetical protein
VARLERIFTYNRDDNLATWAVVSWLLDQDQRLDSGSPEASAGAPAWPMR